MKTRFADKVFRLIFILVFVMGIAGMPGKSAEALGSGPSISVLPEDDVIHAFDWPLGVLLMLEIDDPGTSQTPDYVTSHVVLGPNNYEQIEFGGTFDIQPGYLVTVSDGNIARQHTVTHLAVTNIDMDADTISGIANPGSNIFVSTNCDANGCANRNLIADENGNWLANFASVSDPSQGDGVYDVRLASGGTVHEHDEDWDSTRIPWIMWPPTIGVDVDIDRVQGWDWPLGATVSFEIDDPLTPETPDYTNAVTVETADWDPDLMHFRFYTNDYDVKPGDIVTATDGNITKQLIVTHFRITGADLDLDTVYGIADPGQDVSIWTYNPYAHDGKSINREAIADSNGNWSANFGIPGNEDSEQEIVDIRNGSFFDSVVGDEDWDCTRSMWDVPNPTIGVHANYDQVDTYIWDMGNTLTLEIDNPATTDDPDYTATQTVTDVAPWDPSQTYVLFDLYGVYDIQVGDVVEISNGSITKTTVVSNLAITDVHLDTDMVEGMAEPGQTINVGTCWQDVCANRDETADQDGHWLTNFALPGEQDWEQDTLDLQPGSWIYSSVSDDDDDITGFGWYEPIITVATVNIDIYGNHIFASDWIVGSDVTVSFDIPGSDEEWDYSKTVTVPEGWGAWCQFQIDIDPAIFRIASGQVVRITDGTTTRQATIPDFSVTSEDPTADTISGTAPAGSMVTLWTSSGGSNYQRNPVADSEGQWFADFAHPGTGSDEQGTFDVIPGDGRLFGFFWISQPIDDFVGIKFMWDFGPYFHVFPEEERIETYVWPIGANLTVTIDNPATPQNPDVTRTQENSAWQTNFEELGTILPGFIVSITDGLVTKTHTVTDLALTYVDSQTDIVTGTAEPGNIVDLRTCCVNGYVYRHKSTGDNRIWLGDFSVPGEGNDEQDTFDIRPGDEGDVQQADIDGDTTALRWRAPEQPSFTSFVVFGQEGVWLKENTDVISGDVAANIASERPYLTDGSEVTIGQDVQFMDPASRVMGDTVYLRQGAQVYDVFSNDLKGHGILLGTYHTPVALPLVSQLPAVPSASPGTQNFDLKKNATLILDAGSYGKLETKKGATITFTGGVYHFTEWNLGEGVKMYFTAPTEIRIAGKLDIGSNAFVGPASATQLTASDLLIYVLGENGKNGKIGASPKAASFGMSITLNANVYTPNGTLWIRERSSATGSFFGKWVEVGQNVTLTLDNGWR